jgi:hypothetical protein
MADYTPAYVPGRVITLTASGTVSPGDLLTVSGSGTVAKAAFPAGGSPSPVIVGVAGNDAVASGRVTVYARGEVHESVANGTVTAGDLLVSPPNGATAGSQVSTLAASGVPAAIDVNNSRAIVGVALTTASNPAKVRWMEF